MTTATLETARVWLGCLACYNAGNRVGGWYDAASATDVDSDQIHDDNAGHVDPGEMYGDHEELWIFDHEGLPITGECSPMQAQAWADAVESVDEWQRGAYLAFCRSGLGSVDGDGISDVSDFEEAYCGERSSWREYADEMAGEMLDSVRPVNADEAHALLERYFDFDAFARDLAYDYATEDAPAGAVYVFRSI